MEHRLRVDLTKKLQELLGPMELPHAANDLSSRDVESSVKARRPVALVVVRSSLHLSRTQLQQRLGAVQRLDLRLLVYGEHQGVGWRAEVESDHVDNLLRELRIIRDLEGADPMRLQVGSSPRLLNLVTAHPSRLCHRPKAPVRRQ